MLLYCFGLASHRLSWRGLALLYLFGWVGVCFVLFVVWLGLIVVDVGLFIDIELRCTCQCGGVVL